MHDTFSYGQDVVENILIRKWSTLASLSILLYEHVITFNDEIQFIWRRPKTTVRSIYIFARYLGILTQSVNAYLVFGPLSSLDMPETICKRWFAFQISVACCLMEALDMILMIRVYALHNKNWRVGIFLLCLFFGQIIVVGVFAPSSVYDVPYNGICDNTDAHPGFIFFAISVWITHMSLGLLTAVKYDLRKFGVPIVRVVTRDGAWIFAIICSLFATIVPYTFVNQVEKAHIVFGWPISIMSLCCCRIIMNMQTLKYTDCDPERHRCTESGNTMLASELDTLQFGLQEDGNSSISES